MKNKKKRSNEEATSVIALNERVMHDLYSFTNFVLYLELLKMHKL